jgi:hypothetical protein
MDAKKYLNKFQRAADGLDKQLLKEKQIEVAVGEVLDSVFLKLYKRAWAYPSNDPLTAETRIFFSVWINDAAISEQKLLYNIHAFKLRKLKGYAIESRKFAAAFRNKFKAVADRWKNVSVNFGPLTLMGGWLPVNPEDIQKELLELAGNFLTIAHLIDDTLNEFKR